MNTKFIIIWSEKPGVGRRTLARAIAESAEIGDALWVNVNPAAARDLEAWLPRFQALSPLMLKNYLRDSQGRHGYLELKGYPNKAAGRELCGLLKQAYAWVVWTSPVEWSSDVLEVLDQATDLFWVTNSRAPAGAPFQDVIDRLASLHYPNSFVRVVLNHHGDREAASLRAPWAGKHPVTPLPHEDPPGVLFRQAVRQLLRDIALPPALTAAPAEPGQVVEDLKNRIKPQLVAALDQRSPQQVTEKTLDSALAEETRLPASRRSRGEIYARVLDDVLGLGPLQPLLRDASISEIMVGAHGRVFVEKAGRLFPSDVSFSSEAQLRTVIDRIVAPIGRRVDESTPLCDARLADGSRVNIILPPLALDGPALTIRKFMQRGATLAELVQKEALSSEMEAFLAACIRLRKNMVISGGTGSGKTTLLNALSGLIPDQERIVTIEDAAELRLQKPHVIRLESRPANAEGSGAIPIRRLVINALRMRPDRIVVGECRGGEALDMLQAMNTGHDGSLTTLHANSPRDALRRLETMVLMAGIELPVRVVREQIQGAVQVLVHLSRLPDGSRKISSITEVTGIEGEVLTTQEVFRHSGDRFEPTCVPTFKWRAA